ncbi:MAG: cytochrome o ubiquinol oxidase subunit III [Verrucomicrobia bacterium]|nr:cytochrome o ubiquinol oxidase subunit III [Verrucomicrobiota bacterium]
MTSQEAHLNETFSKTTFGFWTYLMTDCVLFATLFATFIVLHNNTYGGPSGKELFSLPFALTETLILLASSFTCTLSKIAGAREDKKGMIAWFAVTFLLGLAFICMELNEFTHLVQDGNSWQRSAFLSAFFTLVGTHGLHISLGLIWMVILLVPVSRNGLTPVSHKRLTCLRMFWHFLDVVWIFIFTIVYLMGSL